MSVHFNKINHPHHLPSLQYSYPTKLPNHTHYTLKFQLSCHHTRLSTILHNQPKIL
jgi:hypothetical protein